MKTSAILNSAAIGPAPAPKMPQSGARDAGTPFKQVLSREVSERRDTAKQNPKETNGTKEPEGIPASSLKTQAPNEHVSGEADRPETEFVAEESIATQLLTLATQLAQFNAVTHDPAAAYSGALPGKGTADGLPARDMLAVPVDAESSAGIALDRAAHFEQQLGLLTGKAAANTPQSITAHANETQPAISTATLIPAQQPVSEQAHEVQPGAPAAGLTPVQQIVAAQTQVASAQPTDKLAPQVGTKGWDQALGQRMVWMVTGAQQSASLTLNPPDLGPLQVVLNVSNTQATANFIATQPEVRQALEAAMPRLREMLEDAGIQLGQANVSAGTPQQHGAFSERRQGSASFGNSEDVGDTPIRVGQNSASVARQGLVDTFA